MPKEAACAVHNRHPKRKKQQQVCNTSEPGCSRRKKSWKWNEDWLGVKRKLDLRFQLQYICILWKSTDVRYKTQMHYNSIILYCTPRNSLRTFALSGAPPAPFRARSRKNAPVCSLWWFSFLHHRWCILERYSLLCGRKENGTTAAVAAAAAACKMHIQTSSYVTCIFHFFCHLSLCSRRVYKCTENDMSEEN